MRLCYNDAEVQVYCGDASHLDKIPDVSVDCIATDPPFGLGYVSGHRTEAFEPIAGDEHYPHLLMQNFLLEAHRVLKPNSALYIFTGWNSFARLAEQVKEFFKLGHPIVWCKNNWSGGGLEGDWANRVELIVYSYKGRHRLRGARPSNVLMFKRVDGQKLRNPAEKPVPLLEYLISKSSDPGDVILDPFIGSGSTLEAAVNMKRKAIGVDIDDKEVETTIRRLKHMSRFSFPQVEVSNQNFQMELTR